MSAPAQKALPSPADHDGAHRVVAPENGDCLPERQRNLGRQRVESIGPAERDHADAVRTTFDPDRLSRRHVGRHAIVRPPETDSV